jgi:glutathione S-transferase
MLTLHYHPGNANLAPHMLLREAGAPFELALVDRANRAQKSPAYLKLNPNGRIPVLVDGDLVLYEAAAICLHLADRFPDAKLAPPVGTPARATFYKWLVWMTNTLQARLMHYFYPEQATPEAAAHAGVKAAAEADVVALLGQLEALLASHGGPWLLGADFGGPAASRRSRRATSRTWRRGWRACLHGPRWPPRSRPKGCRRRSTDRGRARPGYSEPVLRSFSSRIASTCRISDRRWRPARDVASSGAPSSCAASAAMSFISCTSGGT